ncbi:MAG: hypothetical protein DRP57_04290, partial [Spirochaetes bacterium]
MKIERIVKSVDLDNFVINFQSSKTIEEIQRLSGMEGAYQVEYQTHFICLVGENSTNGQSLRFAIPLAFYNYYQEVSGAAIEFNLEEVQKANTEATVIALEKYNEFETTEMYQKLNEFGIDKWEIVGMNSFHFHPSGINGFSGTDYRTDIKHPGVCYPLSVGKNLLNIAMMGQHRSNYAELILSEATIFDGELGGERHYAQARCLTLNKGFTTATEEAYTEREQGWLDNIFGTTRTQLPKPLPPKARPSFALKSNFNGEAGKMGAFIAEIMKLWEECDFEADLSGVLKTSIERGHGRSKFKKQRGSWDNPNAGINHGYNGLFDDYYDHYDDYMDGKKKKKKTVESPKKKEPTYYEAVNFLLKEGYDKNDLEVDYSFDEIKDEYWSVKDASE